MTHPGIAVVVARRMCAVLAKKDEKRYNQYRIDKEKCIECNECINLLGCPALIKKEGITQDKPPLAIFIYLFSSVVLLKSFQQDLFFLVNLLYRLFRHIIQVKI